jgi:hypothetical protein
MNRIDVVLTASRLCRVEDTVTGKRWTTRCFPERGTRNEFKRAVLDLLFQRNCEECDRLFIPTSPDDMILQLCPMCAAVNRLAKIIDDGIVRDIMEALK